MKPKFALKCVAVLCAMTLMACGEEESETESEGAGGSSGRSVNADAGPSEAPEPPIGGEAADPPAPDDESGGSPDESDPQNEDDPAEVCGEPMEKSCDLPTPVGACDTSAQFGFCIEYFATCLLEDPALESGCDEVGGRFIRGGGCPIARRLGGCVDENLASSVAYAYAMPGITAQQVRTSCEEDGDALFCAD